MTAATPVSQTPLVPAANQIPTKCLPWLVTLPRTQEETVISKGENEQKTELQPQ